MATNAPPSSVAVNPSFSLAMDHHKTVIRNFKLDADPNTHNGVNHVHEGVFKGEVVAYQDGYPATDARGKPLEGKFIPEGYGRLSSNDGDYEYSGYWSKGIPNGRGKERHEADGREINGTWNEGYYSVATVKKLSLPDRWAGVYDPERVHGDKPTRTLEERYNDGKTDALDAFTDAGALSLVEDPGNQSTILLSVPPLGLAMMAIGIWGLATIPYGPKNSFIYIQIQSMLVFMEGLVWICFVAGPVYHNRGLEKLKWISFHQMIHFAQAFNIAVLFLDDTLDDIDTGRNTTILGISLFMPGIFYEILFNVNFLKHVITNFRKKEAIEAYNRGSIYIDVTDYPVLPMTPVILVEVALLAGITYFALARNGDPDTTMYNGGYCAAVVAFFELLIVLNLLAKAASAGWFIKDPAKLEGRFAWWASRNCDKGEFISYFVWWNNVFTGLLGLAFFVTFMVALAYLATPGRTVSHAEGFGVVALCYALHCLFACFLLYHMSRTAKREAKKCIREDREQYMQMWKRTVKKSSPQCGSLERLAGEVRKVVPKQAPVQLRSRVNLSGYKLYERIYKLCREMSPLVNEKVKYWAVAANNGIDDNVVIPFDAHELPEDAPPKFRPAPLKKHARSIEKTHRCYFGHPDKCVDIVRGSIVCATLADVEKVLRIIHEDEEVKIVRIKNRFDRSNNAKETAGYRDLAMNLQLATPETFALQAEEIVFELQVQLVSMDNLKYERHGHANYRKFRNLRAA